MDTTNFFFIDEQNRYMIPSDVLSYEEWQLNEYKNGITLNPNGFYVFISPKDVRNKDEYLTADKDPYWAETNLNYKDAQVRLMDCTLELFDYAGFNKTEAITILDLACGKGNITAGMKNNFKESTVFGLDISITAIEKAVNAYKDIHFIVANAFNPPFAAGTFNAIVCNNFLEHISDPYALEKNVNRMLKPGGYFIFSTPSRYNFANLWSVLRGRTVNFQNPTHHFTEYTVGQLKEQLTRCGFEAIKIISKPLPLYQVSWKTRLKYKMVKPIFEKIIQYTHSHHILESTAFVLARKVSS